MKQHMGSHRRVKRLSCLVFLSGMVLATGSGSEVLAGEGGHVHGTATSTANSSAPPVALDPSRGKEIGLVFESYFSPFQEPGEESETPKSVPKVFQSSAPSKTRAQREADGHRAHGMVRFSKDLSRAYVDVKLEGVRVQDINMFHIHCGKPGTLGPILVDFSHITDIQGNLADGLFSVEVTNEALVTTVKKGEGLVGAMTAGCLVNSPTLEAGKPPKVSTVAGMATIAMQGELYFNLHTVGQTYYGDIRGQILPVSGSTSVP